MITTFNTRILLVDDEEIVRDSLRESLRLPARKDAVLAAAAAALFDDPEPRADVSDVEAPGASPAVAAPLEFQIDEAASGQAGFEKVQASIAAGRPYAVIFLDMRMPGWDGLRTVQHIREIDTRAEIVFVTAYSDHSVDEVVAKAGANVGYHCKPFAPEEIRQLATKGAHDWHKVRGLEQLIEIIGKLRGGEREMNVLLNNILGQILTIVGTESALLGRTGPGGVFEPLLGVGAWQQTHRAGAVIDLVGTLDDCDPAGGIMLRDNVAIMHLESFRIAALLSNATVFNAEKVYLLKLFLTSAGQALENSRLQETVLRSEKLSALGGALAGIVHDLRNPVGNIQSLCDLVDAAIAEERPGEVRELIPLVREASDDAMSIVNDVLDFTRKARIERAPLSLRELGRQLGEKTRHIFAQGAVRLEVRVPAEATISVDAPKLQRALVNLIKNACEVLEAKRIGAARVTVTLGLVRDHVVIDVADNGPGIPPELQGRLFEPFATHGKSGGTGLGLAIVKQIAESHGGTLTAQSSPAGATFTLSFPNE